MLQKKTSQGVRHLSSYAGTEQDVTDNKCGREHPNVDFDGHDTQVHYWV